MDLLLQKWNCLQGKGSIIYLSVCSEMFAVVKNVPAEGFTFPQLVCASVSATVVLLTACRCYRLAMALATFSFGSVKMFGQD